MKTCKKLYVTMMFLWVASLQSVPTAITSTQNSISLNGNSVTSMSLMCAPYAEYYVNLGTQPFVSSNTLSFQINMPTEGYYTLQPLVGSAVYAYIVPLHFNNSYPKPTTVYVNGKPTNVVLSKQNATFTLNK